MHRPMLLVLDCSVIASLMFVDEQHPYALKVAQEFKRKKLIVPPIFQYEMMNVLLLKERRKRISSFEADSFWEYVLQIPIEVMANIEPSLIIELSRRHKLTSYDASYLALAKQRGGKIATLDDALKKAAMAEKVFLAA